jgi:hypothetical protein
MTQLLVSGLMGPDHAVNTALYTSLKSFRSLINQEWVNFLGNDGFLNNKTTQITNYMFSISRLFFLLLLPSSLSFSLRCGTVAAIITETKQGHVTDVRVCTV